MDEINFIITFQDYIETIHFFKRERKEQIAYLMFYITEVSKLRDDMTPKIITHRINDQIDYDNRKYGSEKKQLPRVTETDIHKILKTTKEYFTKAFNGDSRDRENGETAYMLTDDKRKKLWEEFDRKMIKRYKKKAVFEKIWVFITLVIFTVSFIYMLFNTCYDKGRVGISWQDYLEKINFDEIEDGKKAVYILYYITEMTGLNEDMEPQILSDRIVSLGYARSPADSIKKYLDTSDLVISSNMREGAYKMSAKGKARILEDAGLKLSFGKEEITFKWLWENVPLSILIPILLGLSCIIPATFRAGYLISKKINS